MGKLMAAAAVGLAGFATQQANASVVIDVRATQLNGAAAPDPKTVAVVPGDVVTLGLFVNVSGTNGLDDEGLQAINGAIRSSTGGLLGNLAGQLVAPFNGSGSQVGTPIDIDSDGDLDVTGSNPNLSTGFFIGRNAAGFSTDGQRLGEGETFLACNATFTVGAGADGSTVVDWLQHRTATGGNNLAWGTFLVDGNNGGTTPSNPTNTPISTTGGVTLQVVPEPSGLALAGLGVLGLLARRKKNA